MSDLSGSIVAPDFKFAPHALERMAARGISADDVTMTVHSPFHVQGSRRDPDRVRLIRPALNGNRRGWLVVVMNHRYGLVITAFFRATAKEGRR